MSDRIHALAEVWREMISTDHHKTKDGYFAVVKSWSYDHAARYHAEHNAYIGDDLYGDYRESYAEAEADLIKHLLTQIENQRTWAEKIMGIKEEDRWSEGEARHMLEVVERNKNLIKGKAE